MFYLMHTTNAMNIINLVVRISEVWINEGLLYRLHYGPPFPYWNFFDRLFSSPESIRTFTTNITHFRTLCPQRPLAFVIIDKILFWELFLFLHVLYLYLYLQLESLCVTTGSLHSY